MNLAIAAVGFLFAVCLLCCIILLMIRNYNWFPCFFFNVPVAIGTLFKQGMLSGWPHLYLSGMLLIEITNDVH